MWLLPIGFRSYRVTLQGKNRRGEKFTNAEYVRVNGPWGVLPGDLERGVRRANPPSLEALVAAVGDTCDLVCALDKDSARA